MTLQECYRSSFVLAMIARIRLKNLPPPAPCASPVSSRADLCPGARQETSPRSPDIDNLSDLLAASDALQLLLPDPPARPGGNEEESARPGRRVSCLAPGQRALLEEAGQARGEARRRREEEPASWRRRQGGAGHSPAEGPTGGRAAGGRRGAGGGNFCC